MDKELVFNNIKNCIDNGIFLKKYIENSSDIIITDELSYDEKNKRVKLLENIAASVFNAIIIACQLFDDEERIIRFIDEFSLYNNKKLDILQNIIEQEYGISEKEACERLNHGFGVHFTTTRIMDIIRKKGKIAKFGDNAMFSKEEDAIIENAKRLQTENDEDALNKLSYLCKGFGAGVSSYGSRTNGFWMYHTPESLSFLFGNISYRNKDMAMKRINECIYNLPLEDKEKVFNMMSDLWDRLVGDEQEVGCVLIDRDAFNYGVDNYYFGDKVISIERRPFNHGFNGFYCNDNRIINDIDCSYLKFIKIPTVMVLEKLKLEYEGKKKII